MKEKIYIAGCGGMLGEAFYTQFKDEFELKCTDKDVNEEWLSFLDFRDLKSMPLGFCSSSLDIVLSSFNKICVSTITGSKIFLRL